MNTGELIMAIAVVITIIIAVVSAVNFLVGKMNAHLLGLERRLVTLHSANESYNTHITEQLNSAEKNLVNRIQMYEGRIADLEKQGQETQKRLSWLIGRMGIKDKDG